MRKTLALILALVILFATPCVAQPVGPGVAQIVAAIQAGQVTLGQTTMSASYPVAIASNQTAIPTNPGTAANWGVGATGSGVPANASYTGVATGGATGGNLVGLIQASASVPISVSTATTTQLVAGVASQKIYVTAFDFANGTGTADGVSFEYGTSASCAAGVVALTGVYGTGANLGGMTKGSGLAPLLVVPAGDYLCIVTTAAAQISGSLSYTQF